MLDELIDLAGMKSSRIPDAARVRARFSFLDWIACGLAGQKEPLSVIMRQMADAEGGKQEASLFGGGLVPARMAALCNGATSHALDYDDTHFAHVGHLSVGIFPAAFALAEELDKSARDCIDAFMIGAEAATRIGIALGSTHYNRGFHQTATAGAFGATIASGRLLGLNPDQLRHAIGLCATRASGLKSQFGTMGKPYNAGAAASNGVESARLASLGMTSASDGLMAQQGFMDTHHAEMKTRAAWRVPPSDGFLFEDNLYKLHACCHGLHAMIEALLKTFPAGASLDDVEAVEVRTNPRWLKVCDIKAPMGGLEVKFSYAWLAGMTLRGDETGDPRIYIDTCAQDLKLREFATRVAVVEDAKLSDLQVTGTVTQRDGTRVAFEHDLEQRIDDEVLRGKLERKASALLGPLGTELWQMDLDNATARNIGQLLQRSA